MISVASLSNTGPTIHLMQWKTTIQVLQVLPEKNQLYSMSKQKKIIIGYIFWNIGEENLYFISTFPPVHHYMLGHPSNSYQLHNVISSSHYIVPLGEKLWASFF